MHELRSAAKRSLFGQLILLAILLGILYTHNVITYGITNPLPFIRRVFVDQLVNPELSDISLFHRIELTAEQSARLSALPDNPDLLARFLFVESNKIGLISVILSIASTLLVLVPCRLISRYIFDSDPSLLLFDSGISPLLIPLFLCSVFVLYLARTVASVIVMPFLTNQLFEFSVSSEFVLNLALTGKVILDGFIRYFIAILFYGIIIFSLIKDFDVLVLLLMDLVRSYTAPALSGVFSLILYFIMFVLMQICNIIPDMMRKDKDMDFIEYCKTMLHIFGLLLCGCCFIVWLLAFIFTKISAG